MELFQYPCPACRVMLQSAVDVNGKEVRCLWCQHVFTAKGLAVAKSAPPPLPPSRMSQAKLRELLKLDHNLTGGILFGLDGHLIRLEARAMEILYEPCPVAQCVKITGMARECVRESLDRISGAFSKIGAPGSMVSVLINLSPPDIPKDGTWLDLPLAIIMLQAAGMLPDLAAHHEDDFIVVGELGLHGEVRRVPGILSIAHRAKPGQNLIVPSGNEKECALILAKPGHEGCRVFPVGTLDQLIAYFLGSGKLQNALKDRVVFEDHIPKAPDFGQIRGQKRAKEAACICAAGGHNLLMMWTILTKWFRQRG